jgi:hypothetical protein
MKIILIGYLIRCILSVFNGIIAPTPGAEVDALKFLGLVVMILNGEEHTMLAKSDDLSTFLQIHAFIAKIFVPSIIVGGLFSAFIWLLSALIILQITKDLKFSDEDRFFCLIIYCFFPSSIMITSVMLREVFQLLFVNLAFFFLIKSFISSKLKSVLLFVLSIITLVIAAQFHKGLVIFATLSVILSIIYLAILGFDKLKIPNKKIIIISMLIFISFCLVITIKFKLESINFQYDEFMSKIIYFLEKQTNNHFFTRATYIYNKDMDSILDIIFFIPEMFVNYFIQPLPSNIDTFGDYIAFFENILRIAFIAFCIFFSFNKDVPNRKIFILLFLNFLLLELVWSIGTVNYGTAIRHHIPGLGLILICFFNLRIAKFNEKK